MTIHTIGDGHGSLCGGWCKDTVITHYIGSYLAYSIGNGRLNNIDITTYDLKENDWVIFSFGEIDCRCHIHKHINSEKTYQDIINSVVDKYLAAVDERIKTLNIKLNVCIYNVIPPKKIDSGNNPEHPFVGSSKERLTYVQYFNACIRKLMEQYGFMYLDVNPFYTDDEGYLNPEYADGSVHIRDGTFLMNYINSICK